MKTGNKTAGITSGCMPVHKRILMLVPHEPDLDPRIKWVIDLCRQFGRTDVIGWVTTNEKPAREYDGTVYVERVTAADYLDNAPFRSFLPEPLAILAWKMRRWFVTMLSSGVAKMGAWFSRQAANASSEYEDVTLEKNGQLSPSYILVKRTWFRRMVAVAYSQMSSVMQFVAKWMYYVRISQTLYLRGRAISVIPQAIVCHDVYALFAGIQIKKLYNVPVLYDSHEFWPEADLQAKKWERSLTAFLEKQWIKKADVVITVNHYLARLLEDKYGVSDVISVPNAAPVDKGIVPSGRKLPSFPVKFLLQGRVAPGRGIEDFLAMWRWVDNEHVVLVIRAPENEYLIYLREEFRDMVNIGRVQFVPPVSEENLIQAASLSDVGVIPYGGPSLNHVYACPNKLSQYMQAGLALLSNCDAKYVAEIIDTCGCGRTYDLRDVDGFVETVHCFVNDLDALTRMKQKARNFAVTTFNWNIQSLPYKKALQGLLERG